MHGDAERNAMGDTERERDIGGYMEGRKANDMVRYVQ